MSTRTFEVTTDRDGFRQGDVIRFLDEPARSDCATIAIVVTADCDLVHSKFQGALSAVPGYHLDDFLHSSRFSSLATSRAGDLAGEIVNALRGKDGQVDISPASLQQWICTVELDDITSNLANELCDDSLRLPTSWLVAALQQLRSLLRPSRATCAEYCSILANARRFNGRVANPAPLNAKMNASATAEVLKALDPRGALPLDYFGILNPGPRLLGMYYVNLRRIEAISPERVIRGTEDEEAQNPVGERESRLIPVIRYALTQRMASLFSRIGVPSTIEESITDHIRLRTQLEQ